MKKPTTLETARIKTAINKGKSKVKSVSQQLKAIASIGKNGFEDANINHIANLVKQKRIIKIKVLDSALDSDTDRKTQIKEIANTLATKCKCIVVRTVGNAITLRK